ncbi:hypothetical protein [Thermohalobacter berrensis]|uniref:Uncharacterized protein n=1 Tax=Thermohalobacter berrensis TaxID=99594 RepID=A0A419T191_9FIRM|nr:hypothetical protein [Thermohalobacter berrensis]RKD31324.1 hypothetical protein BET03_12890 [Thermohalobacter berrensis]
MPQLYSDYHKIFSKIKLLEGLEKEIVKRFQNQYGINEVKTIVKKHIEKYGDYIVYKSVEEITSSNINTWLEKKMKSTKKRYTSILKELLRKYKVNGILLARLVHEYHGFNYGRKLKNKEKISSAYDIFIIMSNYIFEDSSCNNSFKITKKEKDLLGYIQYKGDYFKYWHNTEISYNIIYDFKRTWIEGFVNGLNPSFKYQVSLENVGDKDVYYHRIFKK